MKAITLLNKVLTSVKNTFKATKTTNKTKAPQETTRTIMAKTAAVIPTKGDVSSTALGKTVSAVKAKTATKSSSTAFTGTIVVNKVSNFFVDGKVNRVIPQYTVVATTGVYAKENTYIQIYYDGKYGYVNVINTNLGTNKTTAPTTTPSPSRAGSLSRTTSSNTTATTSNKSLVTETYHVKDWSNYDSGIVLSDAPTYNNVINSSYVSSKNQQLEDSPIYVLPGYKPAAMRILTKEHGKNISRAFEFVVGPTAASESFNTSVIPVKTGGGWFIMRGGSELNRLALSGYLLDSKRIDERRIFMESFYKKYLIDKVNAFHEYFNESTLYIDFNGYTYMCILTNLDLNTSAESMYVFRYTMNLLVLACAVEDSLRVPDYLAFTPSSATQMAKVEAISKVAGPLYGIVNKSNVGWVSI